MADKILLTLPKDKMGKPPFFDLLKFLLKDKDSEIELLGHNPVIGQCTKSMIWLKFLVAYKGHAFEITIEDKDVNDLREEGIWIDPPELQDNDIVDTATVDASPGGRLDRR